MSGFRILAFAAVAGFLFAVTPPKAAAKIKVEIGVAPDCPYGYYDYAPYSCVPGGYHGPEWFTGGVFVGVGPWFHGAWSLSGNVDNSFDLHHGYNKRRARITSKSPGCY
jgi:hypothetical protein